MKGSFLVVRTVFLALGLVAGMAAGTPAASPLSPKAAKSAEASRQSDRGRRAEAHVAVTVVFSRRDQQVIRRYFEGGTSNLPPGLAKRGGHLPPGLEKHLERNGTLPPGLQKRVQPFPDELERQLPRLPGGYLRVVLEGHAVILGPDHRIADLVHLHGGRQHGREGEDEDRAED
jgi:hypothetical protein